MTIFFKRAKTLRLQEPSATIFFKRAKTLRLQEPSVPFCGLLNELNIHILYM